MDPQLRCPTCNARQSWSDTCRRCKCDLSLVHALLRRHRDAYQSALRHLREGNAAATKQAAGECYGIHPDEDSARLVAISSVATHDFFTALQSLRMFSPTPASSEPQYHGDPQYHSDDVYDR